MGLSTYLTEILLSHHVDPDNVQIISDCAAIPTRPPPKPSVEDCTGANENNRTSQARGIISQGDHRWSSTTTTSPPRISNRKRTGRTTRTTSPSYTGVVRSTNPTSSYYSTTTTNTNSSIEDRRRLLRKTCSESALIMPQRLQSPVCHRAKLQLCGSTSTSSSRHSIQRQSSLTIPNRLLADWE